MATPQSRLDQIRQLVNDWEQMVGYAISVNDAEVQELADEGASSTFDVGQYFARDTRAEFTGPLGIMPWAKYGMSSAEFSTKADAFNNSFLMLTGQTLPTDLLDRAFKQFQGTMTGAQFQTWLLAQDSIKNTYGWLKYGLDFQQFQQQKLSMNQSFGLPLSDAEAVAQLQYMHAAQGPNVSAAAQPTLTQVEKKQAQVGAGQSVVR